MSSPLHLIALLLALHVALSDLRARRVSNRALLVALCAGAIVLASPWGGMSAQAALTGGLCGLAALLPFYAIGWMGAGDVKFFATLGFLLGWPPLLPIWIVASLLAGAHAVCLLAARQLRGHAPDACGQSASAAAHAGDPLPSSSPRSGTPYAACLALGAALALLAPEAFAHG